MQLTFVVGTGRCGSTLLSRLLREHPDVLSMSEFFSTLLEHDSRKRGSRMADIRRLKQTWDELGRKDPLWAILSVPDKKGNKWRLDEFFETGRREIQDVLSYLRGRNLTSTGRRVLDFGCGVGRLSQALAEHFDEVHGVDLSDSMIAIARRHIGEIAPLKEPGSELAPVA